MTLIERETGPNDWRIHDGAIFACIGIAPLLADDGEDTGGRVLVWMSRCAECGVAFTFSTAMRGLFKPSRRCQLHKSPGRRVNPRSRNA